MRKIETNSIRYSKEVDEKFQMLSKKLGRTKKQLFVQMVDYFYRSKKDPDDGGDEILKRELSAGINRVISFIRQQEKDFLLPIFSDSGILKSSFSQQKEYLEVMAKHLLKQTENTGTLVSLTEQNLKGLKYLVSKQQEKEYLKKEFSRLLDYYITQREEMGWTTSTVKKETLVSHVKQMLHNL